MTARVARVSTGLCYTDLQGNPITLQSLVNMPFSDIISSDIFLPPSSYFVPVPIPAGVVNAAFVWVYAAQIPDLKAAIVYDGQAACPIPQGCAMSFYTAPGVWVSSVLGGTLHVAMGA